MHVYKTRKRNDNVLENHTIVERLRRLQLAHNDIGSHRHDFDCVPAVTATATAVVLVVVVVVPPYQCDRRLGVLIIFRLERDHHHLFDCGRFVAAAVVAITTAVDVTITAAAAVLVAGHRRRRVLRRQVRRHADGRAAMAFRLVRNGNDVRCASPWPMIIAFREGGL